ncbi:hypothetical protein PNOK_0455600 [Pyrrhoderma noxium]|uniref:Uncharacterized protein n=1 Tax=Pyrrhoderma noxium TaxID=2282107 RepID=A0A286UJ50_9AGAM|nr:hypothetical protein PNOK_0455600 [Pyrrhoderma noxium]
MSAESQACGSKLSEASADETRRELAVFDSRCELKDLERQKIEFKVPPISSGKTYDCDRIMPGDHTETFWKSNNMSPSSRTMFLSFISKSNVSRVGNQTMNLSRVPSGNTPKHVL